MYVYVIYNNYDVHDIIDNIRLCVSVKCNGELSVYICILLVNYKKISRPSVQ